MSKQEQPLPDAGGMYTLLTLLNKVMQGEAPTLSMPAADDLYAEYYELVRRANAADRLAEALERIRNRCDASHWTAERRWTIRDDANTALAAYKEGK